ncbi:hypothetical protein DFAR_1540016 [Desulfarculales bacterium]
MTRELARRGRALRLTLYPLTDPLGRQQRLMAYARDVTIKRACLPSGERQMLAEMQRSERLVAAGLAHEINSPLGIILCYAELLKTSLPQGQAR